MTTERLPEAGDLSGYINRSLRWMHSVWDPQSGWVDVGYEQAEANRRAEQIRARGEGQS